MVKGRGSDRVNTCTGEFKKNINLLQVVISS